MLLKRKIRVSTIKWLHQKAGRTQLLMYMRRDIIILKLKNQYQFAFITQTAHKTLLHHYLFHIRINGLDRSGDEDTEKNNKHSSIAYPIIVKEFAFGCFLNDEAC